MRRHKRASPTPTPTYLECGDSTARHDPCHVLRVVLQQCVVLPRWLGSRHVLHATRALAPLWSGTVHKARVVRSGSAWLCTTGAVLAVGRWSTTARAPATLPSRPLRAPLLAEPRQAARLHQTRMCSDTVHSHQSTVSAGTHRTPAQRHAAAQYLMLGPGAVLACCLCKARVPPSGDLTAHQ